MEKFLAWLLFSGMRNNTTQMNVNLKQTQQDTSKRMSGISIQEMFIDVTNVILHIVMLGVFPIIFDQNIKVSDTSVNFVNMKQQILEI